MKNQNTRANPFATLVFLTATGASVGGALISIAAAQLGLPITAWTLWYLGIAGFIALLVLGLSALVSTISLAIRGRSGDKSHLRWVAETPASDR